MSKKEQIEESAMQLFNEMGFHGVTTSQIARASKVATGTLFHHFKDKEELIHRIFIKAQSNVIQCTSSSEENRPGTKLQLKHFVSHLLDQPKRIVKDCQYLNAYLHSSFAKSTSNEELWKHLETIFLLIEKGKHEGIIKDIDSRLLLRIFWSILYNLLLHSSSTNATSSDEQNEKFQLIWDTLKS